MSTPHAAASHFDEMDPHGFGSHTKHAHHVVSGITLQSVLAILLLLTAATVGAAQLEVWIMKTFAIELPRWVNVVVAMSIATVKATLVMMYFMLLRYSNPVNTVVMLFCFLAFGLFLFFTILDLGTRGAIDRVKVAQVQPGGIGGIKGGWGKDAPIIDRAPVAYWRDRKINEVGEKEFKQLKAASHKGHGHDDHAHVGSTASQSRARSGLTPGLFDAEAPAHGEDKSADHSHETPAAAPAAKP